MTAEMKQDFTLRISQANRTEMVVVLYDILFCYLEEAKEASEKALWESFCTSLEKARSTISELMASLNLETEIGKNTLSLYFYCIRRIAKGVYQKDGTVTEEVEGLLRPLRDAYAKVAMQNPEGPVMGNSQTVYAGLTYGKNQLTENLADQGSNRGMFA